MVDQGAPRGRAVTAGAVVIPTRYKDFRLALGLLTLGFAVAPVNAQLRNDELYNDIAENRTGELIAGLNSGLSPDALLLMPQSDRWISLLELALRASNDDAAVELTKRGASTDIGDEFRGMSFLEVAAQQGLSRTVSFVIAQDSAALVLAGEDPLMLAIYYGRTETARVLLREMLSLMSAVEIQPVLDRALRIAAHAEVDVELMEALVRAGADPEASPEMPAAVLSAVQSCSPEHVTYLLKEGVDPNPSFQGTHIATYAFACFAHEEPESDADAREILQLLSDSGADVCSFAGEEAARSVEAASALNDLALCGR